MMARDYHHPFQPYDIQQQFMDAVYDCLDEGRIGIFESPTGTGKSLSLICGSLTWLREHKRHILEQSLAPADSDGDEPEWILEHEKKQKRERLFQGKLETESRLRKIREKEDRARYRYENGEPPHKKLRNTNPSTGRELDNDSTFLLDDYESDDNKTSAPSNYGEMGLSAETRTMIEKLGLNVAASREPEPEVEDEMKIFFCSRTHSQLTQFVHELRRVKAPVAALDNKVGTNDINSLREEIKHVTLGSRKTLCINEKVKKLASVAAINDRCLELQQGSMPRESRCTFLPNKDNEALIHDFRDYTLARIRDIEDFGKLGQKLQICPYYATRAAIKAAEVVTLPYPLLLQKAAREALNLSLKGHIVIIDEAHNLMDAISNTYSVSINSTQLHQARAQLVFYLQKFRNRLKGKNRSYVAQLLRVIDSVIACVGAQTGQSAGNELSVQPGDLLAGQNVDQINLYKLMKYLQESKLARKVDGYQAFVEGQSTTDVVRTSSSNLPILTHFQSFLVALTNPAPEGRFFLAKSTHEDNGTVLKYLLLDPTEHFKEIVDEARAVVLAGGTMSPMDDYIASLFSYLPRDRIQTLSCGHVIPSSSLSVSSISLGPHGGQFDFTFDKRKSTEMLDELGAAILSFAQTIPDGLVVFFPSYAYLDSAVEQWQKSYVHSEQAETIWTCLGRYKKIFTEPNSKRQPLSTTAGSVDSAADLSAPSSSSTKSSAVDAVLAAYSDHIHSDSGGAILLAVVGASLSEGINFSDRLGRGVAVIGLPFANAQSPEWQAKLEFVRRRAKESGGVDGNVAARAHYENACMRLVNQSVGRAIRHRGDYATILLLDRRYTRTSIRNKLPGWMQASMVTEDRRQQGQESFTAILARVKSFFASKAWRSE